jgi:hypothetical protein
LVRTIEPVWNVDAALVVEALNEANVPAPKADPARETRSTAKRSFLTVDTQSVSAETLVNNMGGPGGWVWERLNAR